MFSEMQRKMIFIGAETQGREEARIEWTDGFEVVSFLAEDGVKIAGAFGKALGVDAGRAVTVIYFYGNAMCLADAVGQMEWFLGLGVNVLMVEYEGYGLSGGVASESGCYAAGEAGLKYLLSRGDVNGGKIVMMGWSLGGAVAVEMAQRRWKKGTIAGVVTISGFTSMGEVAKFHYPLLPVGMVLTHLFESERKLEGMAVPYFLAHGERDEIIPFFMMGRLAAAARKGGCEVTEFVSEEAGHNDFFAVEEEELGRGLKKFFDSL